MGIPVARITARYFQVKYCPFTGRAIYDEFLVNALPTLLFVHYWFGAYAYVSDRLVKLLMERGVACSADDMPLEPNQIIQHLDLGNAFVLEVDDPEVGVTSYCFVAPELPFE